ncbi:hypothetical protein RIF29_27092 [Crotalaria pallida]|uniref:Uncharacterized protein n=1 Tax=Crotalaria pallida TaxID=3830 RepID=A0AAN9EPF1_CROPI
MAVLIMLKLEFMLGGAPVLFRYQITSIWLVVIFLLENISVIKIPFKTHYIVALLSLVTCKIERLFSYILQN